MSVISHESPEIEPTLEQAKAYFLSTLRRVGRRFNEYQLNQEVYGRLVDDEGDEITFADDAISAYFNIEDIIIIGPNLQKVIDEVSLGSKNSRISTITYHRTLPIEKNNDERQNVYEEFNITLSGGEGGLREYKSPSGLISPHDFVDPLEESVIKLGLHIEEFAIVSTKHDYTHRLRTSKGNIKSLLSAKTTKTILDKPAILDFTTLLTRIENSQV